MADTFRDNIHEFVADMQADLTSDLLLRSICQLANESGFEVGVRLFTASGVFSGLLIGGGSYFRAMADEIDPPDDRSEELTPRSGLAASFRDIAAFYDPPAAEDDADNGEKSADPARVVYVHLKDAWLHSPSNQDPLLVGYWRGRLSGVIGWALGTYGTSE